MYSRSMLGDDVIGKIAAHLGLSIIDISVELELGNEPAMPIEHYINKSYIADGFILGIYDNPEFRLISFFHEVGHLLLSNDFKKKWKYSALHLEVECWNLGIEYTRNEGILFSDAVIKWGYEQALGYAGHDERELVGWTWVERAKELFINK